jgi:hypothetical protein
MPGRHELIPHRSPAEIAADTKRNHGSIEKVATTTIKTLTVRGVRLSSRYDKAIEYELMRAAVLTMGPLAGLLKSLFCNSKVCCCYDGVLRECGQDCRFQCPQHHPSRSNCSTTRATTALRFPPTMGTLFGDGERYVWLDMYDDYVDEVGGDDDV